MSGDLMKWILELIVKTSDLLTDANFEILKGDDDYSVPPD
jgi:hypothetical protein